jgi:F-type H+-transporting ATPase subunit b
MEILRQLGVNDTIWIQLVLFLIAYFFLSQFLFKPYQRNLKYREKNTGGSVEEATQLNASAERLAMDYQGKMKSQNEQATALYEQFKSQGQAEEDRIVAAAREEAARLMEQTRIKISTDIKQAREVMRAQIPQLSGQIASRVLGRDISG